MRFEGTEILNADAKTMRGYWGDQMSMVFQDPMTALNPVLRVEQQITESLHEHLDLSTQQAHETALALLTSVGIPEPARRLLFVRAGEGRCAGEPYQAHTAARLEPGEAAAFAAEAPTELFVISAAPVAALAGEAGRP